MPVNTKAIGKSYEPVLYAVGREKIREYARAVGETVTVRVDGGTPEVRRVTGTLESADGDGFTLTGPDVPGGTMHIAYDRIERARTVFEWGPAPAPRRTKSERVKRP